VIQRVPRGYENCAFYCWFHTGFIEENRWVQWLAVHLCHQQWCQNVAPDKSFLPTCCLEMLILMVS